MSEYYCSHQPPCCPQVDKLKEQLAAAHESRDAYKQEVARMSKTDDILAFAEERDQLRKDGEQLRTRVERLEKALRAIRAGKGVYEGFHCTEIAKEALRDGEGKA